MNFNQLTLSTFQKQNRQQIVWQPRIEYWYKVNKGNDTLPERYKKMGLMELFDDLGASVRPYFLFNDTFVVSFTENIKIDQHFIEGGIIETVWETPLGNLTQLVQISNFTFAYIKYPIERLKDLKIFEYILDNQIVKFNNKLFTSRLTELDDRGAPTIFLPRIPIQRLFIEYMGIANSIYLLHEYPAEVERFMYVIEKADDEYYREVCKSPVPIINFGDNIHADLLSPQLFEKYVRNYYKKRNRQLHNAGKFTHPHWDGKVKPLLRYAIQCGFDGIEALTPLPQGDVTLEEIKQGLGDDLVLLDGIPALYFLPSTPLKKLKTFTLKLLDMFAPNIILGISDELSPNGDIERVRFVAEIVKDYNS